MQRQVIAETCENLLYGFDPRGAAEHGASDRDCTSKDLQKLITNMSSAMQYRALKHTDDHILTTSEVAATYTGWMHEWLAKELRPEQQKKLPKQKSSIFAVWVRNTFGSKAFLMAMLQFGPNLMPSGAPEHAHRFARPEDRAMKCLQELVSWLSRFANALSDHRQNKATQDARQRSGKQRNTSGLTQQERDQRSRRDTARQRLQQAEKLQAEVDAFRYKDYRKFTNPRSWYRLKLWEQQELAALQKGELRQDFEAAQAAHGGRAQAPVFRIND